MAKEKKDDLTKSLTNLYAQLATAKANNDTKTARLIQLIIDRLEKPRE